MVYDDHLYYCTDQQYVKSMSMMGNSNGKNTPKVQEQVYEKKQSKKDAIELDIIETDDLKSLYIANFLDDKTVRHVKTHNGRIVKITYADNCLCANPDKTLMQQLLGDEFKNQSLTFLGEEEFKAFYPNHKQSQFTKETFDNLSKHGNIVESFNEPLEAVQHAFDINKCRTACWMDNQLGDYEVFGVENQIEDYAGSLKASGIFYVELDSLKDRELFMRGNTWYSKQFILIGLQEGYNVTIKYQLLASDTLPADHFKPFAEHLIKKYPKNFKYLVNTCIGHRGRTQTKVRRGYVETDFAMAVSAFHDNNEDQLGFIDDKHVDEKKWRMMKGKMCDIHTLKIDKDTTHYMPPHTHFR